MKLDRLYCSKLLLSWITFTISYLLLFNTPNHQKQNTVYLLFIFRWKTLGFFLVLFPANLSGDAICFVTEALVYASKPCRRCFNMTQRTEYQLKQQWIIITSIRWTSHNFSVFPLHQVTQFIIEESDLLNSNYKC